MPNFTPQESIEGLVLHNLEAWAAFADRYELDAEALEARIAVIGMVISREVVPLSDEQTGLLGQLSSKVLTDDEFNLIKDEPSVLKAQDEYIRLRGTTEGETAHKNNHFTELHVFFQGIRRFKLLGNQNHS